MDTGKLTTPMVIDADGVKFLDPSGNVILQMGNLESPVEKRYLIVQEVNLVKETSGARGYEDAVLLQKEYPDHKVWILIQDGTEKIHWRLLNKKYVDSKPNTRRDGLPWLAPNHPKELELFAVLRGLL